MGSTMITKRNNPFAKQLSVRTQSIPLRHEKTKLNIDNETEIR